MSSLVGLNYSLRALGGRMGSEWERERRDTLFLMGAIALAAVPQAPFLPIWIPIAFVLMFCWRLAIVFSGRPLPSFWIRCVGAASCLAAVFAQYGSLIGREQGVAMLTLFLGLKLLEMKARRDLFVVIFLCFFLLLTTFFQSQSGLTALFVIAAVAGLIATMITMQFGQREASIAVRFRQSGWILVQAIPIALALFVLFPRLSTPLWGLQGEGTSAQTGLSSSMAPGGVANLSKSFEVVMRAKFDGPAPATRDLYWRGPVLGQFDGRTWTKQTRVAGSKRKQPRVLIDAANSQINYEATLEPSRNRWMLALDMVTQMDKMDIGNALITQEFTLEYDRLIDARLRYRAQSHLNYRLDSDATVQELSPWLQLPSNFNPRTAQMAREWQQDKNLISTEDYVRRALLMFHRQQYHYTLQPQTLGQHSVDEFLFDTRAGFCEHYSSSFVVLMRMLGIPARVVTGYQGGEVNPVNNVMVVRQADAHAWTEVWHTGQGWVRIDPTAAVAPERVETSERLYRESEQLSGESASAWNKLRFSLDALANRWNQWVLNFDRGSQKRLLDSIGLDGSDWHGLAGLLAVVLTALIGVSALLTMQPRAPRDPTGDAYEAFCMKLAALGVIRQQYETPTQFLKRAVHELDEEKAKQARRIVSMYTRLRYGSLSGVYIGQERRKTARERLTGAMARRVSMAKDSLRTLRRAVKEFAP